MSTFKKIQDYIIKNETRKIQSFLKVEKTEFIKTLFNTLENGNTLLTIALSQSKFNMDIVKLLIQYGANPDGITLSGNTNSVPIGLIIKNQIISDKEIISLLELFYQYGFDINYYGNDLNTPLLSVIDRIFKINKAAKNMDISLLEYFLKKGSDPNVKNALSVRYVINLMNSLKEYNMDKITPMIDLLLYYGSDPYLTDYNGMSAINYINSKDFPDSIKTALINKLFVNLDDIIKDCKDILQIKKLAKAFKIKFDEKNSKEICECITYIRENFDKINFEEVIELRKGINGFNCVNDSTFLTFTDLNEYNKDDIITLPVGKDTNYCFHKNELLSLLQTKKNPYTGQELFKTPKEFLDFFQQVEMVPNGDVTLEEAIQIFNEKMVVDFTLDDFLDIISHICKPVNVYIDYKNLKNLNLEMIKYFGTLLNNNLQGRLKFFITSGLKINSQEYNKIKLYQLLLEVIGFIKEDPLSDITLTSFQLTYIIEKILTYKSLTDRITSIIMKYNIDLYNEENIQIFRKTKINIIPSKMLKNFDGDIIPVDMTMITEIFDLIIKEGGSEVTNMDAAINLWNDVLGYFLRI